VTSEIRKKEGKNHSGKIKAWHYDAMRANKYEDVSQCFDTVDWMKKVITAELLTTYASYVSQ